jgi:hypothetical protein
MTPSNGTLGLNDLAMPRSQRRKQGGEGEPQSTMERAGNNFPILSKAILGGWR